MNLEISDRWVSVQEIAHYLGISKETIYRWLEAKKIPAHKIGRQWKFKISEIDIWVKSDGAVENSNENKK